MSAAPIRSPGAIFAPLVAFGIVPGLDAMRAALARRGDPHRAISCVHIAGTNGKGSVSATVAAVLRAAGLRTGLYTSPHLHRFVERVQVDGAPVDDMIAESIAETIVADIARRELPSLTFFEAATLLAWETFSRAHVDIAVMEVGMGGRLDATTVCTPRVTAITRIALDHTQRLGDTLAAIAHEKAGILKAGVPCVLGPDLTYARSPDARAVIEATARAVGAPLIDAVPLDEDGDVVCTHWRGAQCSLRPSLRGAWQRSNLAVALAVLDVLAETAPITASAVERGVSEVRWPGRMERVGDVLFDAAHNPDGAQALAYALRQERVGALVFGASRDKDIAAMTQALRSVVSPERWVITAAVMERAADPDVLAMLHGGVVARDPAEALRLAQTLCAPGELTVVCGSIFVVAAVRAALLGIEQEPPIAM
jgi:dihydrofolate synthase/folylpolyglutamate synthase